MKKLIMTMVAAALTAFAYGDEEIRLTENGSETVSVPFSIKSYTPSNKDVVRVERTGDMTLRVSALKKGQCDLEVFGDMDMTQKYQITVGGKIDDVLKAIVQELEKVPEVNAEIIGGRIILSGEIKTVKKWNYFMKVIKDYPEARSRVDFTPGDELLLKMKANLEQCGFDVIFNQQTGAPESWKANTVALSYNKVNRTMNLQAKVYTPQQKAQIEECVKRERAWLSPEDKEKAGENTENWEHQVHLISQVFVAKPSIRLSVAYMAIGASDVEKIGNAQYDSIAFGSLGFLQIFRDLVHNNTTKSATIGAEMSIFTRFLKEQQFENVSDTGYTLIESWSDEGAKFKSGGTLFVKVEGRDIAELKEIPYGFTINAKGGMLNESNMSVDFDFGISTIFPNGTGEYDRKEDLSKQKLTLPIGRTTLISGFKDMIDKRTPPSGFPVLRNVPILNWFVADSGKELNDKKLVIMVCPEIVDNTQDTKIDVEKEINIPVKNVEEKGIDQVIEDEKPFSGFWSWLNWFTF